MQMSIDEFERTFFNPERVNAYLESRQTWVEQFKATDDETRWTTYFMFLGTLAASGRIDLAEYQRLGIAEYQAKNVPTPERLYTLTSLIDLLK